MAAHHQIDPDLKHRRLVGGMFLVLFALAGGCIAYFLTRDSDLAVRSAAALSVPAAILTYFLASLAGSEEAHRDMESARKRGFQWGGFLVVRDHGTSRKMITEIRG